MVYICLDTNIFVRIVSQGKPGCEMEQFTALKTLVEGGAVLLLVPEVVLLELEKSSRSFADELDNSAEALKVAITKQTVWSEIEDIKEAVLDLLDRSKKEKLDTARRNFDEIKNWLKSRARLLAFTPYVWFMAKRRIIAGLYPKAQGKADQDCSIIESLISFFKEMADPAAELYFCSENHADFAVETVSKDKSRTFVLDPDFQEGLPEKTHYFLTLDSLMEFAHGYEQLVERVTDWQALVNSLVPSALSFPVDSLMDAVQASLNLKRYRSFSSNAGAEEHPEAVRQFEEEVIPKLPPAVVEMRRALTKQIQELLTENRKCASWNERSEYKLRQWLEFVPEPMIPYASLPNLVAIKGNLERYLKVHKDEDLKIGQRGGQEPPDEPEPKGNPDPPE